MFKKISAERYGTNEFFPLRRASNQFRTHAFVSEHPLADTFRLCNQFGVYFHVRKQTRFSVLSYSEKITCSASVEIVFGKSESVIASAKKFKTFGYIASVFNYETITFLSSSAYSAA